jgi:hypothetical protein
VKMKGARERKRGNRRAYGQRRHSPGFRGPRACVAAGVVGRQCPDGIWRYASMGSGDVIFRVVLVLD